jgi:hypothetical protein
MKDVCTWGVPKQGWRGDGLIWAFSVLGQGNGGWRGGNEQ